MALDASDPSIRAVIDDIRDDKTETNWVHLGYEGKNKVTIIGKGSGGFDEFYSSLSNDACSWGFLRLVAGDQESKRVKFVFVVWAGNSCGAMAKSRFVTHKPTVSAVIGQYHVEVFADDPLDLSLEIIMDKIKRSAGANYDLGSNAKGYSSSVGSIKSSAASAYKKAEKETTIAKVEYAKGPLSGATPCDLGGRRMVAPPTEAKKNIDLVGKLDASKIAVGENVPAPAAAAAGGGGGGGGGGSVASLAANFKNVSVSAPAPVKATPAPTPAAVAAPPAAAVVEEKKEEEKKEEVKEEEVKEEVKKEEEVAAAPVEEEKKEEEEVKEEEKKVEEEQEEKKEEETPAAAAEEEKKEEEVEEEKKEEEEVKEEEKVENGGGENEGAVDVLDVPSE